MRLISWNVNGLRACVGKGFLDFFHEIRADAVCLQETKMQPDQLTLELEGYSQYWNSAVKKGYSGTAVFTKMQPISVKNGMDIPEHDNEGRVITCEYENFYLVTVYTPNAQSELARLDYRMTWDDAFRAYLLELDVRSSPSCWKAALPIPSATCTPISSGHIPGGATASRPDRTTRGGASTIFWCPTASKTRSSPQAFCPRSWARTTVP